MSLATNSVEGSVVTGGGHGSGDQPAPALAVEAEAGVEAVAEAFGVVLGLCGGGRYVAVD